MVLWFFTHFLNLKLLLHSEFFVCEYLLFKLMLVVACVYVSNYDIVSFEMVGFMNNNIIAWSQEVSCSYCDYSHHCTSGCEGSTQTVNLCKQHFRFKCKCKRGKGSRHCTAHVSLNTGIKSRSTVCFHHIIQFLCLLSMNVMENAIVREVLCKYILNLLVSKLSLTKEEKIRNWVQNL